MGHFVCVNEVQVLPSQDLNLAIVAPARRYIRGKFSLCPWPYEQRYLRVPY